jgi:uncharacterized protein YigA (DUF484 family)
MKEKVYEMEDDYKERLAALLKAIETRDELAETVKLAPPEMRREGQKILAEMNKTLEDIEALLAHAHEAYQKFRRNEEEVSEMSEQLTEKFEEHFIRAKHCQPEKFAEMEAKLLKVWTPEVIEDFYDRVAIREATHLEEILAENINPSAKSGQSSETDPKVDK